MMSVSRGMKRALAPSIALALLLIIGDNVTSPTPHATLDALTFLAGCWRGESRNADGTVETYFSRPSRDMILGVTRRTLRGQTVEYEFTTIEETDSGIVITPHPGGVPAAPLRLKQAEERTVIWESLEQQPPRRITYRRVADETLLARLEGGDDTGAGITEWRMARAACAGGAPGSSL